MAFPRGNGGCRTRFNSEFQGPLISGWNSQSGSYKVRKALTTVFKIAVSVFCVYCHSYAVAAIKSGDDIKTVQDRLDHATVSFALDVYEYVTDQMKRNSAERIQKFIKSVSSQ